MRSILAQAFFLALLPVVSGCASNGDVGHYLGPGEDRLGVDSDNDRSFHVVATDPQGAGLRLPGYLLAFEKSQRARLGVHKLGEDPHLLAVPPDLNSVELKCYPTFLSEGQRRFLSHAMSYRLEALPTPYIQAHSLFDAFSEGEVDVRRGIRPQFQLTGSPYDNSWEALRELEGVIRADLLKATQDKAEYTHIILGVMGWHNPQLKSMRNLNSLYGNLSLAARDAGATNFRPLFVSVTWPSGWDSWPAISSYPNKANDADELGSTFVNALLNQVLCGVRDEVNLKRDSNNALKVVAIGHSFGARMITRAAFSGPLLPAPRSLDEGADLILALQGAFSVNRFLTDVDRKVEGAPYDDYEALKGRVVMTWSELDTANPAAAWVTRAMNAGGTPGFKRASEHPTAFSFVEANERGSFPAPPGDANLVMLNASSVVKYCFFDSAGLAHSDINNMDMGRLVWNCISLPSILP